MTARDEHERAVELVDLVEEDRHVHGARLGHEVIVLPRAVVLVPLPHIAVEGHLPVDLELVHVHGLAEDLDHRLDHAWMPGEAGEGMAVEMGGEVGPDRVAPPLADVLRPALGVEAGHLVEEHADLFRGEQTGKEQPSLAIKLFDLR